MIRGLWKSLALATLILSGFGQSAMAALPQVQAKQVSGMTFWISEQHQLPIIEMQIVFRGAGYVSDPVDKQGRAALATSLLMEGAGKRDAQAFRRALEEKAIELSVNLGRDHMSVSLKTLAPNKQAAFELLADMLRFARFDAEAMEKIKRQMDIQRQRQQESPTYLAQRAYVKAAYGDHPYANDELGSAQSVEAITRDDLRDYYQRYLAKDAMVISIAGAVDDDEAARLLSGYLAPMPAQARAEQVIEPPVQPAEAFELHVEDGLPQTTILFARDGISRNDDDFYAAYVLNHLLGGGTLTSRLAEELREKRGLTYGVGSGLQSGLYANLWAGSLATKNETAPEAVQALRETLTQISEQGVSAAELKAAKDYITGSFPLQIDSNGGVASYLTVMQLYGLGQDYLSKRNAYFASVTLEQVNAMAREWLAPEAWSWVLVGPKASEAPAEASPVQKEAAQ